jgi:hypothetical protein
MSCIALTVLVLLAGYMFYVARLLWIAFGQAREKPIEPLRAGLSLPHILADDREDCDYDMLWYTQVPALEFLRSAGSTGVSIARMTEFYREFARAYPELCDGSNFSDWLEALQSAEVAVHEGDMIAITEKGRFILDRLGQKHVSQSGPHHLKR